SLMYDASGRLKGVNAAGGVNASYARDSLGLITGITDPNGNTWQRQNDNAGRLVSERDPQARVVSYAYDAFSRVKTVVTPEGSLQITRDAAGNVTQRMYSDGSTVSLTYDADNRPLSGNGIALAYNPSGELVASNGLGIGRDAAGRIASITYAPGKTVT